MGGISRSVDAALPAGPRSWPAGPGALRLKPPLTRTGATIAAHTLLRVCLTHD